MNCRKRSTDVEKKFLREPRSYKRGPAKGCLLFHYHYILNNNRNNNDPLNFWNFQFCWKYQLGNAENAKRPLHLLTNKRCIWWKNFFLYQKNQPASFFDFCRDLLVSSNIFCLKRLFTNVWRSKWWLRFDPVVFFTPAATKLFSLDFTSPNFQISE